ncbi:hypothetical protein SAMN04488009_1628 [Maribacter sedimenticola]|uniref:Uncharacterized protein n=1 Tax=Maribacter sedimenticola TaxID=228956 RepID=A0ABY1SFQ9_9FLAO|nr:hypothetical protein [Maribacter sedimenticola]SNR42892.1 hypothetical protein SAMN04488009_1628 [Maribacter sedimenticola]
MNNKNKHPFKTPEGYFDSFQDKLMAQLSDDHVAIPKDNAFKVPDNYFENFNEKLTKKLSEDTKVIPLFPIKKVIAIAASVAAIALVFFGYQWNNVEDVNFSDLANTDIEAYFENTEFDLTSYEIAEVLPFTDAEYSNMLSLPIDNENILDYLSDNINDFEELNLQENE